MRPKVGCLCPVVRSIPMYIQTVLFGLSGLSKRKRRREGEERGSGRVNKEENEVGKEVWGVRQVRGRYDLYIESKYEIYKN